MHMKVMGGQLLLQQFRALLRKNLLLSWRRRVPTALHLTSSFFFILLIWSVDRSIKSRRRTTTSFKDLPDPPSFSVTPISPCESGFFIKRPCYDFVWSTNSSSTITSIVHRIMSNNPDRPIPASKVLGFNGVAEADDWLLRNPLKCTGALHMEERSSSIIAYGIQTNSTSKMERGYYEDPVFKFQLPLQLAAEREIAVFLAGGFISKSSSSKTVGFCVFIIGFLTQLVTYFGFPYDVSFAKSFQIIWSFFPPNLLAIALFYLGRATTNKQDPGISWRDRNKCSFSEPDCVLTMDGILGWLTATFFLWLLSAIYIDNVFPIMNGVRKPWLYFLHAWYWTGKFNIQSKEKGSRDRCKLDDHVIGPSVNENKDEDVQAEEDAIKMEKSDNISNTRIAVQVHGLMKMFSNVSVKGSCCKSSSVHYAVKGLWMNIEQDSLFCLLGQNGAGKTTTISCITGLLPISDGDVLIYGDSIKSSAGMSQIRRYMGVCPQFDILWESLTGLEHLYLFASIKGLHPSLIKQHSLELMERVKLTEAIHVRAGNYSGGMKRRLSVAIALIGDPKIVCLDEPTTGMDPVTRRHVWSIIEGAKVGRAIILTTHSMEEADILGDRIAIMARGVLRCIGTSIRLKARYGAGYIVNVTLKRTANSLNGSPDCNNIQQAPVKSLFKEQLNVNPKQASVDFITFIVPHEKEMQLPDFFAHLQSMKDELEISDIHVSLTTLEEVFINVAKQSELEAALAEGRVESLLLSNGTTIHVSVGAPFAVIPGTQTIDNPSGLVMQLNWQQDENGRLCVVEQSDPISAGKEGNTGATQIEESMNVLPLSTTEIKEADDRDKMTSSVVSAGWSIEL